jgi:hypothetical protein
VLFGTLDQVIPPRWAVPELLPNCHLVFVYDPGAISTER